MDNDLYNIAEQYKNCTIDTLRKILSEQPLFLNKGLDEYENTPLHLALENKRDIDFIKELLKLGADVNALNKWEKSALMISQQVYEGPDAFKIMELLIRHGADVNLADIYTPLRRSLSYMKGKSLLKSLHLLLECGFKVDCKRGPFISFLAHVVKVVNPLDFTEVSKLLLEFGANPAKDIFKVDDIYTDHCHVNCHYIALVKIVMAYSIVKQFKRKMPKMMKYVRGKLYNEIFDVTHFSQKKCYSYLIEYRNALILELFRMVHDRIDNKSSLFSFVALRCSSGLRFFKNEEHKVWKVLCALHSKDYILCNDLFYASVKRNAVLSILCKLPIYVTKSNSKSLKDDKLVMLNNYVILYLASYLSRNDIVNFILAFLDITQLKKSCTKMFSLGSE